MLGWFAGCSAGDHGGVRASEATEPTGPAPIVASVLLPDPPLLPATEDIVIALGSGGYAIDQIQLLSQKVRPESMRLAVRELYERRGGTFLWFDRGQLTVAARRLVAVMESSHDHGLQTRLLEGAVVHNLVDALDWNERMLVERSVGAQDYMALVRLRGLLIGQLDGQLSGTAMMLARMLQQTTLGGRDLASVLPPVDELDDWVAELLPWHPQYERLLTALERYRSYQASGGFPRVQMPPGLDEFPREMRAETIVVLRDRLGAEGFLSGPPTGHSDQLDDALQADLKAFQYSRGLAVNGELTASLVDMLNVPADQLIRAIQQALKQWRQSPTRTEDTFVQVNLPEYMVEMYHYRQRVQRRRVVIGYPYGTGGGRTRQFHSTINEVVVNPGWSPSETIQNKELVAKEARNKGYLARKGFQWITDSRGERRLFQRPGPKNALGRVVLRFTNPNRIYLHGSPDQEQFEKAQRAWSHGCVRVQGIEELAQDLLDLTDQSMARSFEAEIESGRTKRHRLREPVAIHFEYVLTTVDDQDIVRFLPNIYRL